MLILHFLIHQSGNPEVSALKHQNLQLFAAYQSAREKTQEMETTIALLSERAQRLEHQVAAV